MMAHTHSESTPAARPRITGEMDPPRRVMPATECHGWPICRTERTTTRTRRTMLLIAGYWVCARCALQRWEDRGTDG